MTRIMTGPSLPEIKVRMRQLRRSLGLSRQEISRVTGLSEKTCARYADPEDPTEPRLLPLARGAKHFGYSLDYLAFGNRHWGNDDIETSWDRAMSFWKARLSPEKKEAMMAMMSIFFAEAVDYGKSHPGPLQDRSLAKWLKE